MASRVYLCEQYRRGDVTVISSVHQLASYLEAHCRGSLQSFDNLGRRGVTARDKAHVILGTIYRRFHFDAKVAALVVLSSAVGATVACELEPGACRHLPFRDAEVAKGLYALARTPKLYGTLLHRPVVAGPSLHKIFYRVVYKPFVKFLLEGQKVRPFILARVLSRKYPDYRWSLWEREQRRQLASMACLPVRSTKPCHKAEGDLDQHERYSRKGT